MKRRQRLLKQKLLAHTDAFACTEVDLVVERDGGLFPIEVKAASSVRPTDAPSIGIFQGRLGLAARPGLVIYAGSEVLRLTDRCIAIPFDLE